MMKHVKQALRAASLMLVFDNGMVGKTSHGANQHGVEFLLIDLDLAMTFMDVAETSRTEEIIRRNQNNARKAYDTVLRLLENLRPSLTERQAVDAKLAILKMRLQGVGQQF